MTENFRQAIAETRFEVGETDEAEELFRMWLAADPRWGFGWIAWASCHLPPAGRDRPRDQAKAEQLLREGYSTPGVRDRDAIAARLEILYEQTGRPLDAAPRAPQHVPKVGRNSPCPCGSGRKFKRCCGTIRQDGRS